MDDEKNNADAVAVVADRIAGVIGDGVTPYVLGRALMAVLESLCMVAVANAGANAAELLILFAEADLKAMRTELGAGKQRRTSATLGN